MLLCIPEVLTKEQVAHCRQTMDRAEWVDGRATAGAQSGSVKRNMQLPQSQCVLPGWLDLTCLAGWVTASGRCHSTVGEEVPPGGMRASAVHFQQAECGQVVRHPGPGVGVVPQRQMVRSGSVPGPGKWSDVIGDAGGVLLEPARPGEQPARPSASSGSGSWTRNRCTDRPRSPHWCVRPGPGRVRRGGAGPVNRVKTWNGPPEPLLSVPGATAYRVPGSTRFIPAPQSRPRPLVARPSPYGPSRI